MVESYSNLSMDCSKFLPITPLIEYLEKFDNILSFSKENTNPNNEMSCRILPNKIVKIKKTNNTLLSEILHKLKVNCSIFDIAKSIVKVVKANKDLLVLSEIASHGIPYYDAVEKMKMIIDDVELFLSIDPPPAQSCDSKSTILQIPLVDLKLESIISLILANGNNKLIFVPTKEGRSVISLFLLLTLLHEENSLLINQLLFLLPEDKEFGFGSIIAPKKWFIENQLTIPHNTKLLIEYSDKNSTFFVTADCDVFSAAMNYLHTFGGWSQPSDVPKLCLVQESVIDKFVEILRHQLGQLKQFNLFSCNRKMSLNYIANIDAVESFLSRDLHMEVLTPGELHHRDAHFYAPFIIIGAQPQQEIMHDASVNRFCSFLLTFRNCEEGIALANGITHRHRARLYLCSESVSQCLALQARLDYEEICINTIGRPQLWQRSRLQMLIEISPPHSDCDHSAAARLTADVIRSAADAITVGGDAQQRWQRAAAALAGGVAGADRWGLQFAQCIDSVRQSVLQSRYEVCGGVHTLIEEKPVGRVVVKGDGDGAVAVALLAWAIGNDVLVIAATTDSLCEMEALQWRSLRLLRGAVFVGELQRCCRFDAVISVGSDWRDGLVGADLSGINCRIWCAPIGVPRVDMSFVDVVEELLPFLRKRKTVFITAGGIGTK